MSSPPVLESRESIDAKLKHTSTEIRPSWLQPPAPKAPPPRALPGWSGHIRGRVEALGKSQGHILSSDFDGQQLRADATVRPAEVPYAGTFLSSNGQDGAVWDHRFETTSRAAFGTPARPPVDPPPPPQAHTTHWTQYYEDWRRSTTGSSRRTFSPEAVAATVAPGAPPPAAPVSFDGTVRFTPHEPWQATVSHVLATRPRPHRAGGGDTPPGTLPVLPGRRTVGHSARPPQSVDTLGLTFGKVEAARCAPLAGIEPPHPLGERFAY